MEPDANLSQELQQLAMSELDETPQKREEGIAVLKKMIKESGFICLPLDQKYLMRFLRVAKFDVEKAFERVRRYDQARKQYTEDFVCTTASSVLPVLRRNMVGYLPRRDPHGSRIVYIDISCWNPKDFEMNLAYRTLLLCVEKLADEDQTQICGIQYIFNAKDANWRQILAAKTGVLIKLAKMASGAVPVRIKGMHVVNVPRIGEPLYKLFRLVLDKKLRDRLYLHTDIKDLYTWIPTECLPANLGGDLPVFDCKECTKDLREWEPRWALLNQPK